MSDLLRELRDTDRRLGLTETTERQMISTLGAGVPRSSGTALFGIDATQYGSALSVANNAAATPFGAARNFSGLIVMSETAIVGSVAMFLVDGGGAIVLVAQTGANYTVAVGTAASTNVYLVAGVVTVENKLGGVASYNILALRTRTL